MTRPLVIYERVENVVVDVLAVALAAETVDVRADLPGDWTPSDDPVIVVGVDGTNRVDSPVSITSIVRLVAFSNSPTLSHDLAMLAAGHMETASEFTARINGVPLAETDPSHGNARLCAVTVRTRIRSTPIT